MKFFCARIQRAHPDELETLHPAYFALVMATGIVSISMHLHQVSVLPTLLLWLNAVFFGSLIVLTAARALLRPGAFMADLQSHSRGVGFFTLVAASAVFGSQLLIQADAPSLASVFWAVAAALWLLVTYGLFALLTVIPNKPALTDGINGGWLVSVVAAQSLAILTILLVGAGVADAFSEQLFFAALVLWLGGGALYLLLITLIFFRYTFYPMSPEDLTPPYWINMGALAISTLTGTLLLQAAPISPVIAQLMPFIQGVTLSFWSAGTWWIPMLLLLGFWRYAIRGVPFVYDPLYWGGVFPLGMYSVCTFHLARTFDEPFLLPLSKGFMIIAGLAWCAAFAGLIDSWISGFSRPTNSGSHP
ncbi:tellurite resistance/C4-dicarboxylate transporter family protein [Methyloligella solikamskensis]|uniref:Tellurite resistance/C4-dicarboxylate transporter family protein n=1 Tax=Methyloligella solikamskensis TaxID=1177756 RepID=A0ABW3J7C0_9HYPH